MREFKKAMVEKKNICYSFNFLFHKIRGDNLISLHKVQLLRTGPIIVHFVQEMHSRFLADVYYLSLMKMKKCYSKFQMNRRKESKG